MTGELSKNFHGVGIGPQSKILAVKFQLKIGLTALQFRGLDFFYTLELKLNIFY